MGRERSPRRGYSAQERLPLDVPTFQQVVTWHAERVLPQVEARNWRTAKSLRYVFQRAARDLPPHPTGPEIFEWLQGRVARRELCAATANRIRVQLHRLFELARKLYNPLLLNPLADVQRLPTVHRRPRGLLSPDVTFPRLLTAMPDSRARALLVVMRWHGLRLAEVLALEPKHLDRDAGTLLVERQRQPTGLVLSPLKHDTVPTRFRLHPDVPELLAQANREAMRTGKRQRGEAAQTFLFPYFQGHLDPLMALCREVAPEDFAVRVPGAFGGDAWHVFRHTYAKWLFGETRDMELARRMLRHKHVSTTQRYMGELIGDDMPDEGMPLLWEKARQREQAVAEAASRGARMKASGGSILRESSTPTGRAGAVQLHSEVKPERRGK